MKFFISYCDDGKGLDYARKAKEICKRKGVSAWVWEDDGSSAEWLKSDIANNVDASEAMITLVTSGTETSEPQKQEWSLADSFGKINCSLREKGLSIPKELRSRKCPVFGDSNFNKVCEKTIDDIIESLSTEKKAEVDVTKVDEYLLHNMVKQIEKNREDLREDRIEEFSRKVWEGYLGSTIIPSITSFAEITDTKKVELRNIVFNKIIKLDEFNAENYLWEPAFKQIGSSIARGEERYLIKKIKDEMEETKEACNETKDELLIIEKKIRELINIGYTPNTILAPASMLKCFVHFFKEENEKGKVIFTRELGSAAVLEMEKDIRLRIYLLSSAILSTNVIIYDRSSIQWGICLNPATDYVLNLGIGKRFYPDRVSMIVGTTVLCTIKDKQGIKRIPIVR